MSIEIKNASERGLSKYEEQIIKAMLSSRLHDTDRQFELASGPHADADDTMETAERFLKAIEFSKTEPEPRLDVVRSFAAHHFPDLEIEITRDPALRWR
mgnify:FL=1